MDLVQAPVAAFLKSIGFRMRGRTFNRTHEPGIVQVVNFQLGEYPIGPNYEIPGFRTSLYGKFAVNLGIFISDIFDVSSIRATTFPKEYDCAIRTRLNELETAGERWWDLDGDPDSIAKDVVEKLEVFALPLFERFQSRDAIVRSWVPYSAEHGLLGWTTARLAVGMILLNRGQRAAAQALFDEQIKKTTDNPGHVEYVKSLARRVGLVTR